MDFMQHGPMHPDYALGEFSCWFNWGWFLSFFILLVVFFFLGELYSPWPVSVCLVTAMECFLRAGVGHSSLRHCGFSGGWQDSQYLSKAEEYFLRADSTGRSTP